MDDDMDDDWEMDDWEEEAFDEDVYDHSELEMPPEAAVASFDDADEAECEAFDESWSAAIAAEDDEDLELLDGGGSAATESTERTHIGGGRMGWNAWDVGTVFALGGWLADHHAERTAQQIAATLAERNTGRPATGGLGAAHPPPSSGYPYRDAVGVLSDEDAIDQGALYAELSRAEVRGQDLMLQAERPVDLDRPLVLIISAVPWSSGPQFWVVAEEQRGGFSPARLIPVFEQAQGGGVAVFATDYAHEAVDAAVWACEREGVSLREFHVALRQPPSTSSGKET